MRLLVTGGGTGGHTYPALTAIDATRRLAAVHGRTVTVSWVGTRTGLEAKVAADNGIPFKAIVTGKVRRSPSLRDLRRNVADAFRVPCGITQAIWFVARRRPDVVLSTGGYVAVPVGVAAWLTRRPLVMHEQTTTLGLANRVLARFATVIALSHESSLDALPGSALGRSVVTGNPIRPGLLDGRREAAFERFGFTDRDPLIYVTGGALGSRQINTLLGKILPWLLRGAQVLHQCGPELMEEVAGLDPARYRAVPFVGAELPDVLAAADIVVCRSGAGTVAELSAAGKPAIFIPLVPAAADEQRQNALRSARAGAAVCLTEPTPEKLAKELYDLIVDPDRRARMAAAARSLGKPGAAAQLAEVLLSQARR